MSLVIPSVPPSQRKIGDVANDTIREGEIFGVYFQEKVQDWKCEINRAYRLRIPKLNRNSEVFFEDPQKLHASLSKLEVFNNARFSIVSLEAKAGTTFHRVARPIGANADSFLGFSERSLAGSEREELSETLNQIRLLVAQLDDIFLTVHPSEANSSVFGHQIRNLLLLACTECETQWKGILTANGYANKKPTTGDYFKLCGPLRLKEYHVSLVRYRSFPSLNPFREWDKSKPTKSIDWYHAYNETKHDRNQHFSEGCLIFAVKAIISVWIMVLAQYGMLVREMARDLDNYFKLDRAPKWHPSEVYFPQQPNSDKVSVKYPF